MAKVKVLLRESVRTLGRVGDVVEVAAGYARNYLIPQHIAVEPTPGNIRKIEARRQEIERLEAEKRQAQAQTIAKMQSVELTLQRKTNEQGHLFGSVSATEIAKTLVAQGYEVEPGDVVLPGRLDHVDSYVIQVRFAADLSADIKVWVAPDAESKQLMDDARKAAKAAEAAAAAAAAAEQK